MSDAAQAIGTPRLPSLSNAWPVVLALLALYSPTYFLLARGFWPLEQYAHGPIVVAVILWLVWRERDALTEQVRRGDTGIGAALLAFGLILFVLGRSQEIVNMEVASQVPIFTGLLFLLYGRAAARALWFPLAFALFLIPLPSYVIDTLTGPLKQYVSIVVEQLLYWGGYPIGRSGVVLTMGQYQILIADACSGLNSIYTLSAMGFLYSYLSGRKSTLHTLGLLLSIVPLAFVANVARVIVLMLVTYYFGNDAGQGFFHQFAGVFMFMVALLGLIGLDVLLRKLISREEKTT